MPNDWLGRAHGPAPAGEEEAARLLAQALRRGSQEARRLEQAAGGLHSAAWVAKHLGTSLAEVEERRLANRLLAVSDGDVRSYPALQFTEEGVKPWLDAALTALAHLDDGWMRLQALLQSAAALGGRSATAVLDSAATTRDAAHALAVLAATLGD